MAVNDDRDDKDEKENPTDLLEKVDKRVGLNRILVIVVLVVTVSVIAVMATGMTIMFSRIATLEAAAAAAAAKQESPVEEQFSVLDEQLMLLADFRKSELKRIAAYTQQMELVRADCRMEKLVPYQTFLSSREQDFSQLITSVKAGATNLAGMNKGSKAWLDGFVKTLDELGARSKERKATLDTMLEGVSND